MGRSPRPKGSKSIIMRAKTVNENAQFQRGKDPKSAMDIGLESQILDVEEVIRESDSGEIELSEKATIDLLKNPIKYAFRSKRFSYTIITPDGKGKDLRRLLDPALSEGYNYFRYKGQIYPILSLEYTMESVHFERGRDPKEVMDVGGFDFKEIKDQTWGKGVKDWKDFLNTFNGKRISFVVEANWDTPYAKTGDRLIKRVKDWGFNESMYNSIWFFDADDKPHKQYYIDQDHKVYVVDDVNEEVHFEKGRDPKKIIGIGGEKERILKAGMDLLLDFLKNRDPYFIRQAWGDKPAEVRDDLSRDLNLNKIAGNLDPNAITGFIEDLSEEDKTILYDYILQNHPKK